MEIGTFSRWLKYLPLAVAILGVAVWYDTHCYRSFSAPEPMDAAQVARNLAEGRGFSTDFIRPFSVYLVQQHNQAALADQASLTNAVDFARVNGPHPDLANAPVYPALLAGWFKLTSPKWDVQTDKPFWFQSGHFQRFKPEFQIALLNQVLLLAVAVLTFFIARKLFDREVAWLAALLTLATESLWRFSVSGQSTLLLLVIFLGLIWCVMGVEQGGQSQNPPSKKQFALVVAAGLLIGLGMLTRYAFGWLLLPVVGYVLLFGGTRRAGLVGAMLLSFGLVVAPWIIRNLSVSGTLFGTAGYAVIENTPVYPESTLMQMVNPHLDRANWLRPCFHKLVVNFRSILQDDLLHVGGSWMAVLFFAGLLLGLRSQPARRLRYFTLMCLGLLAVVQALGRTSLSDASPEINSENLLILLAPLVVIFGVVFFLTLLGQMKLPASRLRPVIIVLVCIFIRLQLFASLLPPYNSSVAYPPYYPPEIQKVASWMRPDELMMSDVPWAVAWYGQRQCAWMTTDARDQFFQFNDYVKTVKGLYLTLNTLNSKLFTDCIQGGPGGWGNFVLRTAVANQIPPKFTLRYSASGLSTGMFLTDRQRWQTAP